MKKAYRIFAIAVCYIMILGLVGCGNINKKKTQDIKEALTGGWLYTDSSWTGGIFGVHAFYFDQNMDYCLKRFVATETDFSDLIMLDDDDYGSFTIDLKNNCLVLISYDSNHTERTIDFVFENGRLTLDSYSKIEK